MKNNKAVSVGVWPAVLAGMAERFAFYGLRSVFVLMLLYAADSVNPGLGWEKQKAFSLYSDFLSAFAVSVIVAGILIDTFLSTRKAMITGFLLFTAGLALLIIMLATRLELFLYAGLFCVVAGSSLIRPGVIVALGDNYNNKESGLAAALYGYQWIAVSIAAFFAPMVVSTAAEDWSWTTGLMITAIATLAAAILLVRTKPISIEPVQTRSSSQMSWPDWAIVVIPLVLSGLAGVASELVDKRIDTLFATNEMISLMGITFPLRLLQMATILVGPLFALAFMLFFRRRASRLLPIVKMLTLAIGLYVLTSCLIAWRENSSADEGGGYWVALIMLLSLIAELLLFIPLLTRIAGAFHFPFRATAVAVVMSFSIAANAWLMKWLGDVPTNTLWLTAGSGFALFLAIALWFYGWKQQA